MSDADEFEDLMPPQPGPRMSRALEIASGLINDEVEGVGQGETAEGEPCIRVMVKAITPELAERLPEEIEGVPVEVDETGPITAGG